MELETFTRPALGAVAKLGDLYDCRVHTFKGRTIFIEDHLLGGLRTVTYERTQYRDLFQSRKISERLQHMCVNDDLSLHVLGGTVQLEGSGRYLQHPQSYALDISCTMMSKLITKVEKVNVYDEAFPAAILFKALEKNEATHFVAEVKWGAYLLITASCRNEEEKPTSVIEQNLESYLFHLYSELGTYKSSEHKISGKVKVSFESDLITTKGLPQNYSGASRALRAHAGFLYMGSTTEIEKPIIYVLVPLTFLKSQYRIGIKTYAIPTLSTTLVKRVVQLFEYMHISKELVDEYIIHNFLHPETRHAIFHSEEKFRSKFKSLISRTIEEEELIAETEALIGDYESRYFLPLMDTYDLTDASIGANPIIRRKPYIPNGVILIKVKYNLRWLEFVYEFCKLTFNDERDTYVFNCDEVCSKLRRSWRKRYKYFTLLIKNNQLADNRPRFVYFVYAYTGSTWHKLLPPEIYHFRGGRCISKDVYANKHKIFFSGYPKNRVLSTFAF